MARNSKRNAFTIVELVIVIAVIAILSTVLITTFTGVIESANVSADKQLVSTLNTQLSMHIGKGNDIETVDDLKTALNTQDINYWEKLDPKSAQYGYHYWYNSEKQEIVLATYEDIKKDAQEKVAHVALARFLGAVSYAPKARAIDEGFEVASPRTVLENFYFLDQKGKNANEIADFYAMIENMDEENKYAGAITALQSLAGNNGKNKTLAEAILKIMNVTAVVSADGVFVTSNASVINFVYVPENDNDKNKDNYYLGSAIKDEKNKDVELGSNKIDIKASITIPENVKLGDGCMSIFGTVNVKVNIDNVDNLNTIFHANSVTGTITINGNTVADIDGVKITIGDKEVDLSYRNTVEDFTVGDPTGDIVNTGDDYYIALDKINNKTSDNKISLKLVIDEFVKSNAELPLYESVEWVANVDGVKVDDYGNVTFTDEFKSTTDTIVFTATPDAASEDCESKTITVKIVKLHSATIKLNGDTGEIISDGVTIKDKFVVNYDNASTAASFADLYNFVYAYAGAPIDEFDEDDIAALGCETPNVTMTTDNKYFSIGTGFALGFDNAKITALTGSTDEEKVTVKVAEKGNDFTAYVMVKINDNTNCPFDENVPTYNIDYTYKVGNKSPLTLGTLFAKKTAATGNVSDYTIYIYDAKTKDDNDCYHEPLKTIKPDADWTSYALDFDKILTKDGKPLTREVTIVDPETGKVTTTTEEIKELAIAIDTKDGVTETDKIVAVVEVEVVDGVNITKDSDVFVYDETNGKYGQTVYTTNVVLHDNITLTGESDQAIIVLDGVELYGNYFTITAEKFKDKDHSTATVGFADSGYSMITMKDGAKLNELVVKGPVYPDIASASSTNGYYFFGIVTLGTGNEINNSYISGFCSPVRVQGNDVVINDTVLEGGTWSNLFINKAETITLNNVTTIQNHIVGYKPTIGNDDDSKKHVIGMGIYVHDDQQLFAGEKTLNIYLNNTTQYNWLSKGGTDFGGNVALAKTIVFNAKYGNLIHKVGNEEYVNGLIAYQCLETSILKAFGYINLGSGADKLHPEIKVHNNTTGVTYAYKSETLEINGGELKKCMDIEAELKARLGDGIISKIAKYGISAVNVGVDVWAYSTEHTENCNSCLEDFTKLPNVYANFMSVVNYNN